MKSPRDCGHGTAWHGVAWLHGTAPHSTAWQGGGAGQGGAWHGTARHDTAWHSMALAQLAPRSPPTGRAHGFQCGAALTAMCRCGRCGDGYSVQRVMPALRKKVAGVSPGPGADVAKSVPRGGCEAQTFVGLLGLSFGRINRGRARRGPCRVVHAACRTHGPLSAVPPRRERGCGRRGRTLGSAPSRHRSRSQSNGTA